METIENIKSNHLHLGKKIERVRRLRGMTQTELGQLLGCLLYTSPSPRDTR